jgi:hypothetical protein
MNKKINLTITDSKNTINGFEDLHINQLDSLFSCSVDMIYCSIFNVFHSANVYQVLDAIIEKLRPNGQLILNIWSLKKLAKLYVSDNISDADFFNNVKASNNSVSYTDIIKHISSSNISSVVDVKKDDLVTFLTISKNKAQ